MGVVGFRWSGRAEGTSRATASGQVEMERAGRRGSNERINDKGKHGYSSYMCKMFFALSGQ